MKTSAQNPLRAAAAALLGGAFLIGTLLLWNPGPGGDIPLPAPSAPAATKDPGAAGSDAPQQARCPVGQAIGWYWAPTGTALSCSLRGRFEYTVAHPEGGRQCSGFLVRGVLELLVADRRAEEILLRAELPDLSAEPLVPGAGSDEGGLARAARQPFWVRLGIDGAVRGYRFAEDLDGDQRNFVRGLFSAYVHTVPPDAQGTWEADDADAAGLLVARFRMLDGGDADLVSVERTKLRSTQGAGDEVHPHAFVGRSRATFSRALGWLRDVAVDERTTVAIADLDLQVEVHTVLEVALCAHDAHQVAEPVGDLWQAKWQPAAGHREQLGAAADYQERERWIQRLAGEDLSSLLGALDALLQATPLDAEAIDAAWQAIAWLVRLRPETAADVQRRVAAGLEARLCDMLLSALGAAGTEAAQQVLAEIRHDPGLPATVRSSATIALFQLAQPGARVLGDLAGDLAAASEFSGESAMAMLLLGALAPRGGAARVDGRTPFEVLLAQESRAREQGHLDLWLDALGNAGTEDVVAHAERLAADGSERVRGAAYHALRRVESPASIALLGRGLHDASPAVRADVVAALGEHQGAAACELLIRAARDDADAAVRRAALEGLARMAPRRMSARQALEERAQIDPEPANRSAARALLQGLESRR